MTVPIANVGTGPSDPDPPPKPAALVAAARQGARVAGADEHLLVDEHERWAVCDPAMGWLLVDAPVLGAVRVEPWVLLELRVSKPIAGSQRLDLGKLGRCAVRPVLRADGRVVVGLCPS